MQQWWQDEIGAQVGDDRPTGHVHARNDGIGAPKRQHYGTREMVGIVEQWRHIDQRQGREQSQEEQKERLFHAGT